MTRYGIFCFLGRGHLDPAIAIGRSLVRRGHDVTIYHLGIAQAAVRAANLDFSAIDQEEPAWQPKSAEVTGRYRWSGTVDAVTRHTLRILREGPRALTEKRVDVVIADQLDLAAGTAAESVGLPFLTLSCSPPIYLDETVPPPYFGWQPTLDAAGRRKNSRANSLVERFARPALREINRQRARLKLPLVSGINNLFSKRAIITQLPEFLELPRRMPSHLYYTGQFRDECTEAGKPFDWARLSRRPLVYASMGTIRNTCKQVFSLIALACAQCNVQLVLSLGGGTLLPSDLGQLPGHPIVLHYARQRALIQRASLVINCAGLNTTLECLRHGVPMIAIPVAEDQPGVAARIARAGVGIVLPIEELTLVGLISAVGQLLDEDTYRASAAQLQQQLHRIEGADKAVDLIERVA
jgi:zeaxanthin glucosyltransferase